MQRLRLENEHLKSERKDGMSEAEVGAVHEKGMRFEYWFGVTLSLGSPYLSLREWDICL